MKEILQVQKEKPGKLFRKLVESNLVPEYYEGFLKSFEENILRAVSIMRNEELGVGHGQGSSNNIIPFELAELAVNLTAVIINFLIGRFISNKNNTVEVNDNVGFSKEDIPF